MDLVSGHTLVYGLGTTGIAVARFLADEGAQVLAVDDRPLADLHEAVRVLKGSDIEIRGNFAGGSMPPETTMVVASPGVPPANPVLREAAEKGINLISEIELAFHYLEKPIVAVTGTNGKTTTTELIGHILRQWGKKIFLGGNIGTPLVTAARRDADYDFLVVEVSSFQLLHISAFRPRVAVVLNMGSDHLDYHGSLEAYRAAKGRIMENMGPGDLVIANADDRACCEAAGKSTARVIYFSSTGSLDAGIYRAGDVLVLRGNNCPEERYPLDACKLRGRHNLENCMAAILAARECGCPRDVIVEALRTFRGLPHRVEYAGTRNGVAFYDDSKGTNVDAVIAALESFEEPVVLLLGGRSKEEGFRRLAPLVREKVRRLILFGEAAPAIEGMLGGITATTRTGGLGHALDEALKQAEAGDVVLLSPGCASFDEFRNYRERGEFFKDHVSGSLPGNTVSGRKKT